MTTIQYFLDNFEFVTSITESLTVINDIVKEQNIKYDVINPFSNDRRSFMFHFIIPDCISDIVGKKYCPLLISTHKDNLGSVVFGTGIAGMYFGREHWVKDFQRIFSDQIVKLWKDKVI